MFPVILSVHGGSPCAMSVAKFHSQMPSQFEHWHSEVGLWSTVATEILGF